MSLDILILGGPRFVGRHLVASALARGARVTLFNRGRTEPHAFPQVERLIGDRASDLSALRGRDWDAVIDTCGFLPHVVGASAELLRDHVGHYTFVSSISVYADFTRAPISESAPVSELTEEQRAQIEAVDASDPSQSADFLRLYGPLKVGCERVIERAFHGRCAIVRPGLIIGPYDYMDRFPYWVRRLAEGGEVLAPGRPQRPVQVIDARDLADWMVRLAEGRTQGTFNATGPDHLLTMAELLDACRLGTGSDARWVWVDEAFLLEHEVGAWEELPMWLPESAPGAPIGILQADVGRATAAGLAFRPLGESARDTLAWLRTLPSDRAWRAGLDPAKERDLLEKWKATART
jgi:2'-hydroxyisoflavone reductase